MKKVFASAVVGLALGAVSAVSALDMSIGGGGFFASDFGGGFWGTTSEWEGVKFSQTVPWLGGGVDLFFDVTYAEIGLGLTLGGGKPQRTYDGETVKSEMDFYFTGLNIGVLGKYPIALADNVSLFPAAGIDYALILAGGMISDYGTSRLKDPGEYSALWFKFGAGADFAITDKVFFRPEALYGIRLANSYENDYVKERKDSDADINPALGHGLTVKVGIGYKF